MNSDAQRAANRKYRARKRLEAKATSTANPNRRKPASATARTWNSQQFAGSRPNLVAPPENHSRCSHCGGWGHTLADHYDQHSFTGAGLIDKNEQRRFAEIARLAFPEFTGKPGPWRYKIFECIGEITVNQPPTKSFLRQAAEQIALIRRSRQTVPSEQRDRFTKSLIRELCAEETLKNVRTLVPVAEDNGNTAWVIDAEGMANYTPLLVSDRFDSVFLVAEPEETADPEYDEAEVA